MTLPSEATVSERSNADADVLEITDAMLEAGVEAISGYSTYFTGPEPWVVKVVRAVLAAATPAKAVICHSVSDAEVSEL